MTGTKPMSLNGMVLQKKKKSSDYFLFLYINFSLFPPPPHLGIAAIPVYLLKVWTEAMPMMLKVSNQYFHGFLELVR